MEFALIKALATVSPHGQPEVHRFQTLPGPACFAASRGKRAVELRLSESAPGRAIVGQSLADVSDTLLEQPLLGESDTPDTCAQRCPFFVPVDLGQRDRFFSRRLGGA
jgi:hypothetical protein